MKAIDESQTTGGLSFLDVEPFPQELPEGNSVEPRGIFYPTPSQDGAMARIRVPGGYLSAPQLQAIASIVDDLTSGYIQVTTRANFQIRVILPKYTDTVLGRLREAGFHPSGPGADNPRNVTTNPVSGFDPEELVDTQPWCQELALRLTSDAAYRNIPGKYNIAIDSGGQATVMEDSNDLSAHAVLAGGDVAFRISLGGASPDKDLGILVAPGNLVETMLATVRVHNRLRDQTNRLRFRAKYLWEVHSKEEILAGLEQELPEGILLTRTELPRQLLPAQPLAEHPQAGVFLQKQPGLHYIGVAVPVGQVSASQLRALAKLSEEYGDGTARLTVWQNLLLPNIKTADLAAVKTGLLDAGLHWRQSNLRSGIIACTGSRYCPYAHSDTKGHAIALGDYLEEHLEVDQPINIHFTGCPFSCAQHYVGDIGLLAAKNKHGTEAAYHVFEGGGFGQNHSIGRKVSEAPVPFQELKPYILNILRDWQEKRNPGETFQHYIQRAKAT
jgi:ferredoxin-nitrite reductase